MKFKLVILLCIVISACNQIEKKDVTFGLITDLHYAKRKNNGTRFYNESYEKARIAMEEFKGSSIDFIVELGDLKDQGIKPDKNETIGFLKEIDSLLLSYGKPVYHVLGNHDMDNISKKDFLANITNPVGTEGKSYYSFKCNGFKFIVLDGNYNLDGTDYDSGNFNWKEALIPKHEMNWLRNELQEGDELVVVFTHQLLDDKSGLNKALYISNSAEVNKLLIESERVAAVFQGHHHAGNYSFQDGIHYFTMKGMIEGQLPENNSYAIVKLTSKGDVIVDGFFLCKDTVMKNKR